LKKFLINFLVFSLLGIIFLRPQIFKNHIEIKANEVIYFHGFPITSMVKVIPSAESKYYEIEIVPIKTNIWIGGIESDYEAFNLWNLNLPKGWNISGPENKTWAWINQYDENNKNEIKLKIRAKNYIRILFGYHPTHGIAKVKINDIERIFNLSSDSAYVKWDTIYINEILNFSISPESKKIILDNNVREHLKPNYFLIFLNILIVIVYSLILSIILTFSKNLFLRHFSIIFTILLIYFLAYFPGIYYSDSVNQIWQILRIWYHNIEDWQAVFHTLTFLVVLKIFKHIGFYVFIQIIFASILFSWISSKFRIRETFIILFFLFPLTALFLITAWKDTPWTLSLIWFSFLIYFSYKENKINLLAFILSLSFIMLFRHNGIILIPLLLIFLAILFKDKIKKIITVSISLILIYLVSYVFFYEVLKVNKTAARYQKDFYIISAYVVNNYPFSQEEKNLIEKMLSFNSIKERYSRSVSSLFWGKEGDFINFENFREYRKELRKLALKLIFSDFGTFLEHEIFSSAWIWNLSIPCYFGEYRYDRYIYFDAKIYSIGLYKDPKLPQIQKIIEKITDLIFNYFKILTTASFYFYLVIFLFFVLKNYRLILIPTILNTIIFIFITISDEWRFLAGNYFISILLILIYFSRIKPKDIPSTS